MLSYKVADTRFLLSVGTFASTAVSHSVIGTNCPDALKVGAATCTPASGTIVFLFRCVVISDITLVSSFLFLLHGVFCCFVYTFSGCFNS